MGCGTPAASEKFSRNEGLASVPAIFGPYNPAQPAAPRDLPERQTARRQRKILTFARFAPQDRPRQAARRPFGPVAARRMIAAADREDDPAQQLRLQAGAQPAEAGPIDDGAAIPSNVVRDRGLGGLRRVAVCPEDQFDFDPNQFIVGRAFDAMAKIFTVWRRNTIRGPPRPNAF